MVFEMAILAIVLVGLSFTTAYIYKKRIKTGLWRTWLFWKVRRMDVRAEEHAWEMVADAALNAIDTMFLLGKICGAQRTIMLNKLRRSPGLGNQFSPCNIQRVLKEVIRGRIGTHPTPKLPDKGPYVFSYISLTVYDRLSAPKPTLSLRTGTWRTRQ
jgi:hypothetical protein